MTWTRFTSMAFGPCRSIRGPIPHVIVISRTRTTLRGAERRAGEYYRSISPNNPTGDATRRILMAQLEIRKGI